MGDPVWLDTNIVAAVANGDGVLEAELKSRTAAGQKLLIVPQARQELLYGNPLTTKPNKPVADQQPSPATRVKLEQTMARLKITVDMEGAKIPQAQRVGLAMQDQVKRPKNLATPPSLQQISESDSLVLSQVKAGAMARGIKEPVMLTGEKGKKGVISQAPNYGVKVIQIKGGPPPGTGSSPGSGRPPTPTFGGKIGPGLKSIGGTAVGLGAAVLLDYLASYLKQRVQQAEIEKQMKALEPAIIQAIARRISDVARLQLQGKTAWANVTVSIWNYVAERPDLSERDGWIPNVSLEGVLVTEKEVKGPGPTKTEYKIGVRFETTPYTFSVRQELTKEELDLFRWYERELKWYDDQVNKGGLAPEDFTRLNTGREKLLREFNEALQQSANARGA